MTGTWAGTARGERTGRACERGGRGQKARGSVFSTPYDHGQIETAQCRLTGRQIGYDHGSGRAWGV